MARRARFYAKCDACDDKVTTDYTRRFAARIAAQTHARKEHPDEDPGVFVAERGESA